MTPIPACSFAEEGSMLTAQDRELAQGRGLSVLGKRALILTHTHRGS